MITTATAENALKNIYLDTVINDINKKTNPFLTMIEENTRIASGKNATVNIRCGQAAVGAGTETGDLPVGNSEKSVEISVPLKNLYGTFQISDKALKAASLDPNAFASLLGGEMQNLVAAAQNNLTSMLYGNGKKLLAVFDASAIHANDRKVIDIDTRYAQNLADGMHISICNGAGEEITDPVDDNLVTDFDPIGGILTLSDALSEDKADRYYIYLAEDDGTNMNGIDSVFNTSLYGLSLNQNREVVPCNYIDRGAELRVLDEDAALEFLEKYEEHCQSMPADILLTHPRVKKAIFESLRNTRSNIAPTELAGGFHGITFNGIPMYSDVKCKAGNLYALNSKSFAMHQLCDWTWLSNEDGSILKQLPGKATYMATLVKYADMICDKPFLQGRCSGFSALKAKAE
ncbi:MAG: phage major capsid protein [Eubacteriales bacterium]|nr:phage major capsid protein [Eubacteriales bacterium]